MFVGIVAGIDAPAADVNLVKSMKTVMFLRFSFVGENAAGIDAPAADVDLVKKTSDILCSNMASNNYRIWLARAS